MNRGVLKKLGKLHTHEIKDASLVIGLSGIGLYLYSLFINYHNPNVVEIKWLRNFFALFFIIVAIAPFTKKKWVLENYGWFIFFCFFFFGHYLIYITGLNNFSIDFLLGTYIVFFGSILLINSRLLLLICSGTEFIHILMRIVDADVDIITTNAVIISITTIFIFSLFVVNNIIKYREYLVNISADLEKRVKDRTRDLENYSNELFEKNEDLENFASVISHDLKTPLRNIHSLSSWLIDDNKEVFDEETNKNLETIKEQVHQMDLLIDGVLNYSLHNESETTKTDVDLNILIDKIIRAKNCSNCKIVKKKKLPIISFDKTQILQIFQNLIQNAIIHNNKDVAEIKIDYESNKDMHLFLVKDNGPGIEERYHSRIFMLFQQLDLKGSKGSVGIGLSIVKKIINRNGGEIWLKSKPNEGTTFYFTLPKT